MYINRELINVINLCLKNIEDQKILKALKKRNLIELDDDHYIISEKAANNYYSEKELIDILIILGEGLEGQND